MVILNILVREIFVVETVGPTEIFEALKVSLGATIAKLLFKTIKLKGRHRR
jgi:hypothetical protein